MTCVLALLILSAGAFLILSLFAWGLGASELRAETVRLVRSRIPKHGLGNSIIICLVGLSANLLEIRRAKRRACTLILAASTTTLGVVVTLCGWDLVMRTATMGSILLLGLLFAAVCLHMLLKAERPDQKLTETMTSPDTPWLLHSDPVDYAAECAIDALYARVTIRLGLLASLAMVMYSLGYYSWTAAVLLIGRYG